MTGVSVVIPCYRCSKTIARAVNSVVTQTCQPAELILVDDASGDDTVTVLNALKIQYGDWIRIVELIKNVGAASARNAGWNLASQPYVAFLDADDSWHPKKIEIQYQWMLSNPNFWLTGHGYLQSSVNQVDWSNSNSNSKYSVKPITKYQTLLSNPFATRTVMLKREMPYRFKVGKRYAEDYLLWLQIVLSPLTTAHINLSLAATYKADYGDSGLSSNLWEMEKGELDAYLWLYREKKIGVLVMCFLCTNSIMKYIRRIFIVNLKKWNAIGV